MKKTPILAELDEQTVAELAKDASLVAVENGGCVFLEGEPLPPFFFVLLTGTLQMVKCSQSGKETILRPIRPGEIFAWAALLDGGAAPATARAACASVVMRLPSQALLTAIARSPATALRLLATLSERLRDVHEQLHDIVSERARTRLARLILRQRAREGDCLQTLLPHQLLARMAGITYEESVRILGEWTHGEHPILSYRRGGRIEVLNAGGLMAIAEGGGDAVGEE
ncbi:MAG TPA: Crp/Fnr family transcriptional regulator, partial [Oscillatoriaceae cyanobacterium]